MPRPTLRCPLLEQSESSVGRLWLFFQTVLARLDRVPPSGQAFHLPTADDEYTPKCVALPSLTRLGLEPWQR